MDLTRVEKEKINDSALKIQSARASLKDVDRVKIRDFEEIQECLEMADNSLRHALREERPSKPPRRAQ